MKYNRISPAFACLSFFIFTEIFTSALGMQEQPGVDYSPHGSNLYGGAIEKNINIKVRVSSCVTLGGGCIDKINHVLKDSNQFIVSFMYRFDSPTLIRTLEDKYLENISSEFPMPVLTFLDYKQIYKDSFERGQYYKYVNRLMEAIPTSIVKLGNSPFHHKVIIAKKFGEQAITIIGSGNATFESDNMHSDDLAFIQSNQVAEFFIKAFRDLFRSDFGSKISEEYREKRVQIFHEYRLKEGMSNIKVLFDLLGENEKEKSVAATKSVFRSDDEMTMKEWYNGKVVDLALSTGHAELGGAQKCVDVVNKVLTADNEVLLLFENYISLDSGIDLHKNLGNETPKLIVLDDNKYNKDKNYIKDIKKKSLEVLKKEGETQIKELPQSDDNKVILFQPFTGKKFHHKLIIQYPRSSAPIVYTGSFHLSNNAIKNNSENIIGIQSEELADDYLSSLLLNSGLGERADVWDFVKKYPGLSWKRTRLNLNEKENLEPKETKVLQTAKRLLLKLEMKMNRYKDRLDRIQTIIAGAASGEKESEDRFKEIFYRYQQGNVDDNENSLEKLSEQIFNNEDIYSIWQGYLQELFKKIKSFNIEEEVISDLPVYDPNYRDEWLAEIKNWLEVERDLYKDKESRIYILMIEEMWRALNDLNEYDLQEFQIVQLSKTLEDLIMKR